MPATIVIAPVLPAIPALEPTVGTFRSVLRIGAAEFPTIATAITTEAAMLTFIAPGIPPKPLFIGESKAVVISPSAFVCHCRFLHPVSGLQAPGQVRH